VTILSPARRVPSVDDLEHAGDYSGPHPVRLHEGGEGLAVWFLLPVHQGRDMFDRPTRGSGLHGVYSPPWTFRECADGSLEIRASIACGRRDPEGEYWHGYLDEGNVWRTA
jgi:hypothetical protein